MSFYWKFGLHFNKDLQHVRQTILPRGPC
uniref:Uncharacterized protein n=1 Tax=Musa acuminata subsp. malaccensis TaxID=214687 RepID=A0A804K372_MUSAM